jgi:hypothetical protein
MMNCVSIGVSSDHRGKRRTAKRRGRSPRGGAGRQGRIKKTVATTVKIHLMMKETTVLRVLGVVDSSFRAV